MLSEDLSTPKSALLAATQRPAGIDVSLALRRGPSEVVPRIYLTDLFTARDATQLSALGITHVISVLEHAPIFPETQVLQKLHIPLSDSSDADILVHFPTTTSFIHDALAESPDSRVMVCDTTFLYRVLFGLIYLGFGIRCTVSWASVGAQLLYAHTSSPRRK